MSENSRHRSASPPVSAAESAADAPDRHARVLRERYNSQTNTSPTRDSIRPTDRLNRLEATIYAAINPSSGQTSNEPFLAEVPFSTVREEIQGLHDTVASIARSIDMRRSRSRPNERRRNNRHLTMGMNTNDILSSLADLHHADHQLENASQHMRALLDDSQNILAHTSLAAEEYAGEAETNRERKRRRLDMGLSSSGFPGFSYGHYGQVEPGKLRMEIESCDGGTLEGYGDGSADYKAQNVLLNDDSVYCTKGNRCNLVLRHQGATPFCLTELSIKGPPRGYTDPVQEGMIFVSMESDELLARTAQYQIQYAAPRRHVRLASIDPNNSHIISIRHDLDGTITGRQNIRNPVTSGIEAGSDEWDCRLAQIPSDFTIQNSPPFHVTTECEDSDSDSSRPHRRRHIVDRMSSRLSALLSGQHDPGSDPESSDREHPWNEDYLTGVRRERLPPPSSLRQSPRQQPSMSNELAEAVLAAQEATQEAVKAVGSILSTARVAGPSAGLMAPLAWFFIEGDKSKCIIRFDPPVSGRFILLKMWSPHFSDVGNIDIQSVVARGFAGPRFFPATQLR